MNGLGIYIHIPFCIRKCLYCDFLSAPGEEAVRAEYVQALCREIREEAVRYGGREVTTVFLGGGTPSVLSGDQINAVLSCLYQYYRVKADAEITMEMNPGTVTGRKLSAYRAAGVNRASLGLQSADNGQLRLLGRIHTWEDFLESYGLCREAGFTNINVDLMSALPGQTTQSWKDTLEKAASLRPEHISAYSLIIEEGTLFYERYGAAAEETRRCGGDEPGRGGGRAQLPDEETDRAMYEATKELLRRHGYERYEISNYARAGKECVHNCVYWTRGDYAGFGLGASSMVDNVRWNNIRELPAYLNTSAGERKREVHRLTVTQQMEETMFLGLRMMRGVSKAGFFRIFGHSIEEVYGKVIKKHRRQGLLTETKDSLRLTDRGIDVSNYVMADFLLS